MRVGRNEYHRQWRLKNIDKRRAIEKRYREKNRERLKAASKRYCDKHRTKRRASANNWYHRNKDYVAAKKRQQHRADPSRRRAQQLKHKYGMTLEVYQSTRKAQKDCCAACGTRFTATGKFRACVDHDHRVGTKRRGPVRGVVCNRCNLVLGLIADDPIVLEGLETYLKKRSL